MVAIKEKHTDVGAIMWHISCDFQVETMLLLTGFKGLSLVAEAAFGGDKATFEAVSTAIQERIQQEQVRYRLFATCQTGYECCRWYGTTLPEETDME